MMKELRRASGNLWVALWRGRFMLCLIDELFMGGLGCFCYATMSDNEGNV